MDDEQGNAWVLSEMLCAIDLACNTRAEKSCSFVGGCETRYVALSRVLPNCQGERMSV